MTSAMDDRVVDLLTKGGVRLPSNDADVEEETTPERLSRHLSVLESWLGLPAAKDWDDNDDDAMMEDAAPFDASFYQAVETLLLEVWNPEEASQKYLDIMDHHRSEDDPQNVSLYTSILSIRVTRLLRFWLDLNVTGSDHIDVALDGNDIDKHQNTLTYHMLKLCSTENPPSAEASTQFSHQFCPLVQALYQHVEQLPYLQSQIYLYTQSLMRGAPRDSNRVGQGLSNPQARLAHLQMSQKVTEKLNQEFESHISDLEFIIGEWYAMGSVDVRRQSRAHLGSIWSQFEARSSGMGGGGAAGMKIENTSSSGIAMTLRILYRILLGTPPKRLLKSHEQVLFQHLIPLHRPNSMVLWRDQTSLLDLYHEPLVQCIAVLLQKKPTLAGRVIAGLMEPDVWSKGGNTPKLVLLLHEIDTYILCLPEPIQGNELGETFPILLRTLGSCMASENSRLAQRALPFVKNKSFVAMLEKNIDQSLGIILPFLLRKEPSWNPTVRKMTYNVLKTLYDLDQDRFVTLGDKVLSHGKVALPSPHQDPEQPGSQHETLVNQQKKRAVQNSPSGSTFLPTDYTIKSAMGEWKPPTRGAASSMPPPSNRPRSVG
ncbi:MAG: hypothetical protein SGILL_004286, partial [Bacillariaceae sp.]